MLTRITPLLFQKTTQPAFAANHTQTVAATPQSSVKQAMPKLSPPLSQDTFQPRFGMFATHPAGDDGGDDGNDGRPPVDPYANQGRDFWDYEQPLPGGFNPEVGEHGQFEPELAGEEQEPAEEIASKNPYEGLSHEEKIKAAKHLMDAGYALKKAAKAVHIGNRELIGYKPKRVVTRKPEGGESWETLRKRAKKTPDPAESQRLSNLSKLQRSKTRLSRAKEPGTKGIHKKPRLKKWEKEQQQQQTEQSNIATWVADQANTGFGSGYVEGEGSNISGFDNLGIGSDGSLPVHPSSASQQPPPPRPRVLPAPPQSATGYRGYERGATPEGWARASDDRIYPNYSFSMPAGLPSIENMLPENERAAQRLRERNTDPDGYTREERRNIRNASARDRTGLINSAKLDRKTDGWKDPKK